MEQLQTTERKVIDLKVSLQDMPIDMRLFSLSMRALYSDQAVGTSSDAAQKFRKLRDDTRRDAMVYLKGVLPVSTKFVASISEYFEYYTALSYNEWCDMLPDILQETVGYKEFATTVLAIHEEILVPLKKRKDEAKIIIKEFTELEREFEKKKQEFEVSAGTKRGWAFALSFVPIVNVIATPLLYGAAEKNVAEAISLQAQADIHAGAALTVSETLIPALENFISGLERAAGFFSVMEQELTKFGGKADKASASPKELYYKVMNKQADEMKALCQAFYAVLPAVRTDFLAIPDEGTDQNYVDKWLAKQRKVIGEKVGLRKIIPDLFKALPELFKDIAGSNNAYKKAK